MNLKDEVILITGASAGIGYAIAEAAAKKGAKLVLVARRKEKLINLASQIDADTFILDGDLRETDHLLQRLANAPDPFCSPTILINNAGLALGKEEAQFSDPNDWDTMIDTNIRALVRLTRGLLPKMIEAKHGYIMQIGSVAGSWPYGGGHVYCGTKAFVRQFSLALRADLLGTNVRVTNIEPGLVETEFSYVRFKGDEERANKVYADVQSLSPEDIAGTVIWCLEQPSHVNITTLEVMPTEQALAGFKFHTEK